MNSLACGLGEAVSGNPQLCSGSKSPWVPRSGPDPLPPPFWLGSQDRLHAEAEAWGRNALMKGNPGCWGGRCHSRSVALAPGCGGTEWLQEPSVLWELWLHFPQVWGPGQFQSCSGPASLHREGGDDRGTVERAMQAHPRRRQAEDLLLVRAWAHLDTQGPNAEYQAAGQLGSNSPLGPKKSCIR